MLPRVGLLLLLWPAVIQAAPPDFSRDVAPILKQACVRCHQDDDAKGDVSLTSPKDLFEGKYIVPGKPDESELIRLVSGEENRKPRMPKSGKALTKAEVRLVRDWIAAGAVWPKGVTLVEQKRADKSWWSLVPLSRVSPPKPANLPKAWSKNPIDRFIYAKLHEKGLEPSARATPRTLIRRVTYDLTGLPPSPEAIAAFEKDHSQAAYEQLVDKLLASPAYGEHWGRHWLDVVRFGESNGFERNVIIDNAWPYRDYVIQSLNDDKPFDRLVREHLAGDQLDPGNPAVEVGTTFLVCGPYDDVGNQDAVQAAIIRANTQDEMVRAIAEAFLGMTVGCARCHNHKFDPISQQDYHRMSAAVAGVFHGSRQIATPQQRLIAEAQAKFDRTYAELTQERNQLIHKTSADDRKRLAIVGATLAHMEQNRSASTPPLPVWWVGQFRPATGPFHVFVGGDPQKKAEPVRFASPEFLASIPVVTLPPTATEVQRRLALAEWIVSRENPLTPRVLANRIWGWHFGTGIVDTPSDFGSMGGQPTHPQLLDWLASELQTNGWKLKPIHRMILMSETYQQASTDRPDALRVDGGSRYLWRFPPRRLSGEEIRDSMLQAAGKLDRRAGGAGFRLYKYVQDNVATYYPLDVVPPETYRRAVYHQNARAARVDVLTDFDCPDPAFAAPNRSSTTTALQALALYNHQFTLDMANALAARAKAEAGPNQSDQIRHLFRLALGREPQSDELAEAGKLAESHSLRAIGRAILNSNEFLYLD